MITDRLKSLRTTRKLSQKDFAKALDVSQQTVASWESGRTEPSNNALKKMADYFNVSTDYLLGREGSASPLSKKQSFLLSSFDMLNVDGQNLLIGMLGSLKMSHAKKDQKNVGIVQNNKIKNNYGAVGNFNARVTIG